MKLVLATKNPGKLKEMKALAAQANEDLSWIDWQLAPAEFNPEETGQTFAENALIKAAAAARITGLHSLADDSGIAVDALNGKPGVFSARYSEGSELRGCEKLITELKDVAPEKRTAAYHCVITLVSPTGQLLCQGEGIWRGRIIDKMRGDGGFGFDPIFYLPDHKKTVAQISLSEKNQLSHRAQAWEKIKNYLVEHKAKLNFFH